MGEDVQIDEAEAQFKKNNNPKTKKTTKHQQQHCVNFSGFSAPFPKGNSELELFLLCESAAKRNGLRPCFAYLVRRK